MPPQSMLLCTSHPTDGGTGRIFTNDGVFRVSSQTVSLQHSLTHPLIGIFPGFRVAVYCPNDNFHVHRESEEVEDVDDERRQTLEEAAELDHIWGVWEKEEEMTSTRCKWIKQPSQRENGIRHHVEVHASHREKEWESPSASLIEQDP